ncbi:hypothetical protein [Agromyces marinus]|uniref:Tryptophan-associated transmembrane protein (Trp_oprn_chp) n=1 Tax=Agromyces marinus TaxID=1389020 RepID=A0ABM8H290_9MICO|nr:hypothetical protein [Agromyces marinus]UIP60044.1 hypothetical protein DSM26151_29590 [Agromyces marinus]BDZ54843.1 hypothetical protein GCM10025870_19160 [Agromyces marinus]
MHAPATMTRTWPMLAALGAGLVLAALAAGAGGAPRIVLAGLGIAALGWGVRALHRGRVVAPRATLAITALLIAATGVAASVGALRTVPGLPVAVLVVFLAVIAAAAAHAVRFGGSRRRRRAVPERGAARSLAGLAVGAILVAALATPALAATEAGRSAVPHGEHGDSAPGGHAH